MGGNSSKYTPPFSDEIMKTVAITPKCTALPSIIGSCFIIQDVLRNKKHRRQVYHRIMVGMSVMDLLWAIRCFLSTWPVPKSFNPVIPYASGTDETCAMIGFIGHAAGLTSVLYSASLTLYFLLVVRYGWKEQRIRRYVEKWIHAFPIIIGWGLAFASIPLDLYKPIPWTCFIQDVPYACKKAVKFANVDISECKPDGVNAGAYRWAFFFAWVWAVCIFTFSAMVMIYWGLRRVESSNNKYTFRPTTQSHSQDADSEDDGECPSNPSGHSRKSFTSSISLGVLGHHKRKKSSSREARKRQRSRKFANQAALYVTFFFVTWIFPTVQGSINSFVGTGFSYLLVLITLIVPLQGFFNALIYLRPRYLKQLKKEKGVSVWERLKMRFSKPKEAVVSNLSFGPSSNAATSTQGFPSPGQGARDDFSCGGSSCDGQSVDTSYL